MALKGRRKGAKKKKEPETEVKVTRRRARADDPTSPPVSSSPSPGKKVKNTKKDLQKKQPEENHSVQETPKEKTSKTNNKRKQQPANEIETDRSSKRTKETPPKVQPEEQRKMPQPPQPDTVQGEGSIEQEKGNDTAAQDTQMHEHQSEEKQHPEEKEEDSEVHQPPLSHQAEENKPEIATNQEIGSSKKDGEQDDIDDAKLSEIRVEEKLVFDRLKELRALESLVDDNALQMNNIQREPSRVEKMFEELSRLRTTEAEFLLEQTRRVSREKETAQMELIQSLQDQLAKQRQEQAEFEKEKASLLEELASVRESNAKLASQVAKHLGESLQSEQEGELQEHETDTVETDEKRARQVNGEEQVDAEGLDEIVSYYAAITGVSLKQGDDDAVICTLKDTCTRKVARYQLQPTENEGELMYTPLANTELLPEKLRDPVLIMEAQLPYLQAILQSEFFVKEPNENENPSESKKRKASKKHHRKPLERQQEKAIAKKTI